MTTARLAGRAGRPFWPVTPAGAERVWLLAGAGVCLRTHTGALDTQGFDAVVRLASMAHVGNDLPITSPSHDVPLLTLAVARPGPTFLAAHPAYW